MKIKAKIILVFSCFFLSCNGTDCADLEYHNSITTLNGKLFTGECNEFYINGQKRSKQQYKNGKDHGLWVFYHPEEIIRTIGEFKMGKRIGEWKYFYETGEKWKLHKYENGKRTGSWLTFDKNGQIIDSIHYD